nr:helix-turn-helix domain-containing protein [uncultured Cohaesibacter sp.]
MNEVTIHRGTPRENFTVLRNEIFEHAELSMEALGLLTYLISRPRDWKVNQSHLKKRFGLGRDKFQRIMRELIAAGYVERRQGRSEDESTFGTVQYHVFDTPIETYETQDTLLPENPVADENKTEPDQNEQETGACVDQQPENLVTRSSGDLKTRTLLKKDYITNNTPLTPRVGGGASLIDGDWEKLCEGWTLALGDSFERARRPWARLSMADQGLALKHAKAFQTDKPKAHLTTYIRQKRWQSYEQAALKKQASQFVFIEKGTPEWEAWSSHKGVTAIFSSFNFELRKEGCFQRSRWPPGYEAETKQAG